MPAYKATVQSAYQHDSIASPTRLSARDLLFQEHDRLRLEFKISNYAINFKISPI